MRILGLTDQSIDPPASGGAERVRCLYERLARRHDVEIVNLVGLRERKGLVRIGERLAIRKVAAPQRSAAHYLATSRIAPAFVSHYLHAALAFLYAPRLGRPGWDIVQIDGIALGPLARWLPRSVPVVYSAHNVESEFQASCLDSFRYRAAFVRAIVRIERALLGRSDLIVAVSERDRRMLVSLYGIPESTVVTVPNGFDEERFRAPSDEERASARRAMGFSPGDRVVLFAGSRVPHNEAAVRALAERIAPRLPDGCRVVVVGSVGDAGACASLPRLTVTGTVSDVLPYFHAADIAVNPVETGGGTNIKVLQYLAAGLPVVSTPFGMRGLEPLLPFVRTAAIDEMPARIAEPAGSGDAGLEAALSAFSWGSSALRLEDAYTSLVARRRLAAAGTATRESVVP